ncbi:hypothetical protein LCGC14_2338510 [marine sediment metagenome]|uniref:Uncharacterized protein n=1 Tax=marine sediment metagenome TaxID=412755 RepID=A0A0F9D088_9ZZZZ
MNCAVPNRFKSAIQRANDTIPEPKNRIVYYEHLIRLMQQQIAYLQREIATCRRK